MAMTIVIPSTGVQQLLRTLSLSAAEIKEATGWPDAMVEDYLNMLENIVVLAAAINEKEGGLKNMKVVDVTMSPYEISASDEEVLYNTDGGDIITRLRAGVRGTGYRLINVGSSGNRVTVDPFGTELLFGVNASEYIADQEALIIAFEGTKGWN